MSNEEIKRFDFEVTEAYDTGPCVEEQVSADGEYVRYSDHAAAIRALASQTAAPVQPTSEWTEADKREQDHLDSLAADDAAAQAAPPVQQPGDVRDLHAKIMNLPCDHRQSDEYKRGHRDARHAAAELAVFAKHAALATTRPSAALTDEQIEAIAHRKCTSYEHVPKDIGIKYQFAPHHMIDFARAILAASSGAVAVPVAWGVMSKNRSGIHKLCIQRESAERKAAAWLVEWPNNPVIIRPLVFGDAAPATPAQGQTK